MVEEITNSVSDWNRLKNKLETAIVNKEFSNEELIVSVDVSCDEAVEESDVTELYHFFLLADSAFLFGGIKKAVLKINVNENENESGIKIQQIKQYLSVLSEYEKNIYIFVNNERVKYSQTRFGRINPLFFVNNSMKSRYFYKKIVRIRDCDGIIDILKDFIKKYNANNEVSVIKETSEYKKLTASEFVSPEFLKEPKSTNGKSKSKIQTLSLASLFYFSKNEDVGDVCFKIALSNITYSLTNMTGTVKEKLLEKNRNQIIDQIVDYIKEKCRDMPALAFYFWSVFLRFSVEEKILWKYKEGECLVERDALNKLFLDSLAYSDGLYQLIENSCLHSQNNSAYFTMRLYNTDRTVPVKKLKHVIETIERISEKYSDNIIDTNFAKYHLEIILADNAFNGKSNIGMVDHYNKANPERKITTLKELFEIPVETDSDILIHYGLRTFERTVLVNHGCFIVHTPNVAEEYRSTNFKGDFKYKPEKVAKYVKNESVYNILLPVFYDIKNKRETQFSPQNNFFDLKSIDKKFLPQKMQLNSFFNIRQGEDKEKIINKCLNELNAQTQNTENRILCFDTTPLSYYHIEILAKVIMSYSIKNSDKDNKIAILFSNGNFISEFIRIYACFYDKVGLSHMHHIKNTQIALCSIYDGLPGVNFVLSGTDLAVAHQSARMYAYYNPEYSVDLISAIDYLTRFQEEKGKEDSKINPVFPFDLYLDFETFGEDYDNEKKYINDEKIWFFRHIQKVLETDIRTSKYGCKIEDVHISIGSKIHIGSFYNAELLFHNYGNVFRFAYLIARDIISEHKNSDKKIMLIGYEEYSRLLIEKVKDILSEYFENKETEAIVYCSENDNESSADYGFWPDFREFIGNGDKNVFESYKGYIILPVATTLTTIYKIQNIVERICKTEGIPTLKFGKNTSLILVGDLETNDGKGEVQGVKLKYWSNVDKESRLVYIKHDSQKESVVKYYFLTRARWHKASEDEGNQDSDKCLISVDKTHTLPDAIFEEYNNPRKILKCTTYAERINSLWGCINYSHICEADNHFQYDIDYKKYFKKNEVEIYQWLLNDVRKHIDADAFNIIVSPLNSFSSQFLKSVIDYGFESCARVFNIEINLSFKEEIRTKFNYITQEYKRIREVMGNVPINVYYVDACIVSSATLQRGKQFIHMLLDDLGNYDNINIYKGVIVLANRSSYETIQNILPGHVDDDFHFYVNLNVPSYNTQNGRCPSCELERQYHTMHKRSSTYAIANEYNRLANKHSCKPRVKYCKWLDYSILNNNNYVRMFCEWLYFNGIYEKNTVYTDIFGEEQHFADSSEECAEIIETVLKCNAEDNYTLNDVKDVVLRDKIVELIKNTVVNNISFMRMSCTNDIFSQMETTMCNSSDSKAAEINSRHMIIEIISNKFKEIDKVFANGDKFNIKINWLKSEWLISYIKVISRKQVAQYYHIRKAIYKILEELAQALIGESPISSDLGFIFDLCKITEKDNLLSCFTPTTKKLIFITIIRRLSAMHSLFVIQNYEGITEFYKKYNEQYDGSEKFCKFYNSESEKTDYKKFVKNMSKEEFDFQIVKLIKWAAMSNYDESRCFAIERQCQKVGKDNRTLSELQKMVFLENVQIIYNGINRLSEEYTEKDADDFEKLKHYIEETVQKIKIPNDNDDVSYYEMNVHKHFFEFMDLRIHYKKQYYDILFSKYAHMLSYFNKLKELVDEKKTENKPYQYESICNCIRDITGYEQCKIICNDNHRNYVLATSSTEVAYMENDIGIIEIDKLISEFKENMKPKTVADITQKTEEKGREFRLINVPILTEGKPEIYIVLYKNIEEFDVWESYEKDYIGLWDVRNVLFVRDKLEYVLERDMITLKNMINSHSYVEKLNPVPVVLHISDLHISNKNVKEALTKLSITDFPQNPDLLLITGDVIQGAYTAKGLLDNYNAAKSVIKQIAIKLWRHKYQDADGLKTFIRADWKKRVLISTGNHDYASMNELEATNKKRMTLSGSPVSQIGDTLIKFSYFINFLHELLDVDIADAVRYDLNEIKNYDRLNVSVVNINSNSGVNPYRTNKVKINKKAIENMENGVRFLPTVIYMMHHTPMYRIKYLNDIYYLRKNLDEEYREAIDEKFKNITQKGEAESEVWLDLIDRLRTEFKESYKEIEPEEPQNLMRMFLAAIKKSDKKTYDEVVLEEFDYYLSVDKKDRMTDDRCIKIISNLNEQNKAGEGDEIEFASFIKEHFGKQKNKYCIIGGHTHRAGKYTGPMVGVFENCLAMLEAPRFVSGDKVNYVKIVLNEKPRYEWQKDFSFNCKKVSEISEKDMIPALWKE